MRELMCCRQHVDVLPRARCAIQQYTESRQTLSKESTNNESMLSFAKKRRCVQAALNPQFQSGVAQVMHEVCFAMSNTKFFTLTFHCFGRHVTIDRHNAMEL